jgi:hypothetical protein
MEALLLALIIVRNAYKRHESAVPEAETFKSSDLQELKQLFNAKNRSAFRLSHGQAWHVAQPVS